MSTTAPATSGAAGTVGRTGTEGRLKRFLLGREAQLPETVLLVVAGLLMVASGLIHLYLWHTAYRHVATLGPLFLVQTIACIALAVLLAATRRGVLIVGGLGLMAGTIVGFILVVNVGLFGFKLTFISGWAKLALAVEGAVILVLLAAGASLWKASRTP